MSLFKSTRAEQINKLIDNLLFAQEKMASAEKVDARGLILLTRYLWKLIHQLPDDLVEVVPPDQDQWR